MKLFNKSDSQSSREISRKMAIFEGCTARAVFNLSSGAFIAGFMKYLGASDSVSGKILALPVLAATIQFISPVFIESMDWKKKMVTIGAAMHRLLLVLMVIIPILPVSSNVKIWTAGGIYFISFLTVAFISPAISNMYASFVPMNMRGSYFGSRERDLLIYSTIITLIMGKVLDIFKNSGNLYTGYIILFAVILANTILNNMSFLAMREIRIKPNKSKFKIKDVFLIPIKDKVFRKVIFLFFMWSIGLQFGASYFSIYMVSKLQLSYTFITSCSLILAVFYAIFARIWGRVGDRVGWASVTIRTMTLLGATHLSWFFVFDNWHIYLLIPFLFALAGIAWGGINIALFNIQFDYTPKEGRTLYLGFNAAFSGIVGYGAALMASEFVGALGKWNVNILGLPIGIIQIILASSGVMLLMTSLFIKKAITETKAPVNPDND